MIKLTIKHLKRVMEIEPSLSARGINSLFSIRFHDKMNKEKAKQQLIIERKKFLQNFKGFEICCTWLSRFKTIKTPLMSSYYLKHVVEDLAREYVSNGALIAAAIHLDIPMKIFPDWINTYIAISKKCPYLKESNNGKRRH